MFRLFPNVPCLLRASRTPRNLLLLPPAFRLDDFDIERLSSYEMIHPLLLPEKASLEDALKSEKIPTLLISGTVWKEIRYCVDKLARQELAVMLTLKRAHSVKPKWLAFDLFIPGQKASSGEVSINVDDYLLYTEMLSSHEYYKEHGLHRYLCHLHSHGPPRGFLEFDGHHPAGIT